jgi:hypothetical protein
MKTGRAGLLHRQVGGGCAAPGRANGRRATARARPLPTRHPRLGLAARANPRPALNISAARPRCNDLPEFGRSCLSYLAEAAPTRWEGTQRAHAAPNLLQSGLPRSKTPRHRLALFRASRAAWQERLTLLEATSTGASAAPSAAGQPAHDIVLGRGHVLRQAHRRFQESTGVLKNPPSF